MGTIVALNGGSTQFLGYAVSKDFDGIHTRIATGPVISVDEKMLMGIYSNQALLQYMITNPPNFTDLSYRTVLNTLSFLNDIEKFRRSQILMITISGEIYIWDYGDLHHIDGEFMAVGNGKGLALGALFGTKLLEMAAVERMEIALNAISMYDPSTSKTMGIEKI